MAQNGLLVSQADPELERIRQKRMQELMGGVGHRHTRHGCFKLL